MSLLSRGSSGSYCRVQSPQYLRGGKRPFAQDARLRAREIDDGGRHSRQLPAVERRGRAGANVLGDAVKTPGIRFGRKAVDGVEREDDGLALAQSSDGLVGDVHRLPSTTRSSPVRSGVIVMSA